MMTGTGMLVGSFCDGDGGPGFCVDTEADPTFCADRAGGQIVSGQCDGGANIQCCVAVACMGDTAGTCIGACYVLHVRGH